MRPREGRVANPALPDYLPARMVNEFVYCPRLFFYEWVEGLFAASADTVEGSIRHERVDAKEDALPPPDSEAPVKSRSVTLASDTYRVIATLDLVEGDGESVSPVDYKKGRPRPGPQGPEAWDADRVQIGVQALVLREAGYRCSEGVLYYHETRQRVRVAIDEALVAQTIAAIDSARATAAGGVLPPPLVDSPKCPRCSLVSICLPDETRQSADAALEPEPQMSLFDEHPAATAASPGLEPRRLVPARDDLRPLYVTGYDLTVGKTGEVLQVRNREKTVQEVRVNEISQVSVFGNVQLSPRAVQGLCWAEKPVAHFSYGGWFYGLTQGLGLRNVFLRRDQFARAGEEFFCLHVARCIVASKVHNQRTLILRNHVEVPKATLARLRQAEDAALSAQGLNELLGIEGTAARLYFEAFPGLLKPSTPDDVPEDALTLCFEHRNRRPPRDPVNALLSLAYSLLVKELTIVCHAVGFDPFMGFFHQPRFGRPALALDLMEEFRPLIADSAVLTAINTRMVQPKSFFRVGPSVALTPAGRKAFIHAFEQRMDSLVTHPVFGYRLSYRRVLEVQARMLARVVSGELPRYQGFQTR